MAVISAVTKALGSVLGVKTPKAPPAQDPAKQQADLDAKAAQAANTSLAAKNRSRRASSLLAAGDPAAQIGSALGFGKNTLGS